LQSTHSHYNEEKNSVTHVTDNGESKRRKQKRRTTKIHPDWLSEHVTSWQPCHTMPRHFWPYGNS